MFNFIKTNKPENTNTTKNINNRLEECFEHAHKSFSKCAEIPLQEIGESSATICASLYYGFLAKPCSGYQIQS